MITCPEFGGDIYTQLELAASRGLAEAQINTPVIDPFSNRIALGANKSALSIAAHTATLIGANDTLMVDITNGHGLAYPPPANVTEFRGREGRLHLARLDMAEGSLPRYQGLTITTDGSSTGIYGREYCGAETPLRHLGEDGQRLFIAQVAGVLLKRSMQQANT